MILALRNIFEDEELSPIEKSKELIREIDELGLQPYSYPEPLDPIDKEDIKLVYWLAIAPKEEEKKRLTGFISQNTLKKYEPSR